MTETNNKTIKRLKITVHGTVQGVGFRPFVYRLAGQIGLTGWVTNFPGGVRIEIEGNEDQLRVFTACLASDKPPHADIKTLVKTLHDPVGYTAFEVRRSDDSGEKTAPVLPDLATCPDCLRDIFDPHNRRYRYPFTNCTNCGPRYSIIETLPYDRGNTTMKIFPLCEACRAEYENPTDRRFHAQPNACPECGPHLELWDSGGKVLSKYDESLLKACEEIKKGRVLALKGLGGFQLIVDARNEDAVKLLRHRKHREEKPLALMYPSLEMIVEDCDVDKVEKELLTSAEAPIVLLKKKGKNHTRVSDAVAPNNPYLGVMLPYTPLHHLLMRELNFPIVATSGNLSEEPICIDEHEAVTRLGQIADLFLAHNRPIARQMDDSIARVIAGQPMVMRNARGYAPVTVSLNEKIKSCLAVGAHLKNTIAIARDGLVRISQHIGDLETRSACVAHKAVTRSLAAIYDFEPETAACDLHPDYLSTGFAQQLNLPIVQVQHHYAHVLACLADNQLNPPALGVAWDGTGLGTDNTIWGGEFLLTDDKTFTRAAYLRTFRLPGGDKAVLEPRRTAVGLLYEIFGEDVFKLDNLEPIAQFTSKDINVLRKMLKQNINTPVTSSAGRLFDSVASLLGLAHQNRFEGQAAMLLEHSINKTETDDLYSIVIESKSTPYIVNWEPLLKDILTDIEKKVPPGLISARFHNTMAKIIVTVAEKIGEKQVLLTGGCFQNKYLTEKASCLLEAAGFEVYRHRRIPPNDGGIAAGQILAAAREQAKEK